MSDVQKFWDNKILTWESDKYTQRYFIDVNRSVQFRMQMAEAVLSQLAHGLVVLEWGCGSARLIDAAERAGAKKYIGIDISARAIEQAKNRESKKSRSIEVELYHGDASAFHFRVDLCLSLGFFDWLDLEKLRELTRQVQSPYFLHSYSEKRRTWSQAMHRAYVYMMYGHKTKAYIPNYYTEEQIRSVFESRLHACELKFLRPPQMSFGTWVCSLPDRHLVGLS